MNKEKIVIFVINNTGMWPGYFCMDLVNLYMETLKEYPNTKLQTIQACSVNEMRNFACRYAMGERAPNGEEPDRADYIVQLDDDHRYKPTFINDLMKHKKDVVTGCTSNRRAPFKQTQFIKFQKEIKADENIANPSPEDELMKIDASGPVGMLIKVDVLDKLKYPYYKIDHIGTAEEGNQEAIMGGDIYFCKLLKEAGIDIWLDPKITFPHEVGMVMVNRGTLQL
jgi:hypothetical protein